MAAVNPFPDLMARVRAGDEAAATELVGRYETTVRVAVRTRLADPALRRYFDSADVCQSVLRTFFRRAAAGRYAPATPGELMRLLMGMARRKLARYVRRYCRQQRDYRRVLEDSGHLIGRHPDPGPPPDERAADRDLFDGVYRRLSADERAVADAWTAGEGWPEIAARLGGTAEGRRKQLTRALGRVLDDLGLGHDDAA
jgi:DNA-directed RNA polymerase specialized sigma24 family protein